LHNGKQTMTDR